MILFNDEPTIYINTSQTFRGVFLAFPAGSARRPVLGHSAVAKIGHWVSASVAVLGSSRAYTWHFRCTRPWCKDAYVCMTHGIVGVECSSKSVGSRQSNFALHEYRPDIGALEVLCQKRMSVFFRPRLQLGVILLSPKMCAPHVLSTSSMSTRRAT